MQIEWDEEMCIRSEQCVKALPEVFQFDARGNFRVDVRGGDEAAIRRVVEGCPSGALRVVPR